MDSKASGKRASMISQNVHGFIKGRRKEGSVLTQNAAIWRIRRCNRLAAHAGFDLANAFGSTDWESQQQKQSATDY